MVNSAHTTTINFDKPKMERLKKAYDQAVARNKSEFDFEGNTFVTGYAKYFLMYNAPKLGVIVDL